jgi:hypothetical protein
MRFFSLGPMPYGCLKEAPSSLSRIMKKTIKNEFFKQNDNVVSWRVHADAS